MDTLFGKKKNYAIYNNIVDESIFIAEAVGNGAYKVAKYLIAVLRDNL